MSDALQRAIAQLSQSGALMPADTARAVRRSIAKYSEVVADDLLTVFMDRLFNRLQGIVNPQEDEHGVMTGATHRGAAAELMDLLDDLGAPEDLALMLNLPFKLGTATDVMHGAARFAVQNHSDIRVDEYPALELKRIYDRELPRGLKKTRGGAIVPDPDDAWPARWHAAAEASGDTKALAVLEKHDRMVALKSSGIWQQLGNGAGGYTDTLGNPYDPLAFNTGFRQREVAREDAEALGLIEKHAPAQPARFDWERIVSIPA